MTSVSIVAGPEVAEVNATNVISSEPPPKIRFKEDNIVLKEKETNSPQEKEVKPSATRKERKIDSFGEPTPERRPTMQIEKPEDIVRESESLPRIDRFAPALEEPFVATHREELDGYVKKIIEDKAYLVFETPGGPLERAVKSSKLQAINADRQGALIRLVVEEKGASMNVKFENLETKGIATWRDKIKDEDLEKYDLLRKFALPRKPSKPQ